MNSPKFFRWSDRIKSFGFAIDGLVAFFKTQPNAWIHSFAAVLAISCGVFLKIDRMEWCWILVVIALVFITEMLNTALEFLTDLASPNIHPLAKKVKDIAAAAVLIAAIVALFIAGIIFLPKCMDLF